MSEARPDPGIHAALRGGLELILDERHYLGQVQVAGGDGPAPGQTAIDHWLRIGAAARLVPTPFFDEVFYLQSNPDVAVSGEFGFRHFLQYGMVEGRRPTPWFEQSWYGQAAPGRAPERHPYLHFLTDGAATGTSPHQSLRQLDWPRDAALMHASCRELDRVLRPLTLWLGAARIDRLLSLFMPEFYRRAAGLGPELSQIDLLRHFLDHGMRRDGAVSPLFDAALHDAASRERGLPPRDGDEPALLHWIRFGIDADIVPVGWFDAEFYAGTVFGLAGRDVDVFLHFVDHGLHECRRPIAWFDLPATRMSLPGAAPRRGEVSSALTPSSLLDRLAALAPSVRTVRDAGGDLGAALRDLRDRFGADLEAVLLDMFVPGFHVSESGLPPETAPLVALWHFLVHGLPSGASPSPLFDAAIYAGRFEARTGEALPADMPAFEHYLRHGRALGVVPTQRFNEAFYLGFYTDLDPAYLFSYDHFVRHGVHENRRPVAWFDPDFCQHRLPGPPDAPPYLRALLGGIDAGVVTCPALARLLGSDPIDLARYDALLAASDAFGDVDFDLLLDLFVPEGYDGEGALDGAAPVLDRLIHYLGHGLPRGVSPGPMFMADVYGERLAAVGQAPPFGPAVLHFLRIGAALRIVPTAVFDMEFYCRTYRDIADAPLWPFLHFIRHGVFEGRRFSRQPVLELAARPGAEGAAAARTRLLLAAGRAPVAGGGRLAGLVETQRRLRGLMESDAMAAIMAEIQALDPGVGALADITHCYAAPFHDPIDPPYRAMLDRLARRHYDTVVCVPWIRNGGADLVAGSLTHALRRILPGESVLLLRTDYPHFERPDWIAPTIDVLDLSDLLVGAGDVNAERLLHTLFLGLAPLRVININSRLCWRTFQRYGERLASRMELFAYLFCWDRSPSGVPSGYVSEFFPVCAPHLRGVFTDTAYLKAELERMYALPPELALRLVPLQTPARSRPAKPTMAERGAASAGSRARPVVLWGGRLDQQKRFDIVEDVARLLPHIDFLCWGAAMLDQPPDLSRLPPNITMHGGFRALTDLPLGDSDGWLFTSAWEGMPTTIIELATLGMPLVASGVGGVPDLVGPQTGWLIPPGAPVSHYAAAVAEMVSSPGLRVARAAALQRKARRIFTAASYDRRLADALARPAPAGGRDMAA